MWPNNGKAMVPPMMDGRAHQSDGHDTGSAHSREWPQSPTRESQSRGLERSSAGNLRSAFRSNVPGQMTIRAVTPELAENVPHGVGADANLPHMSRGFGSPSPQSSPRSIPGGMSRRQGMVFNDSFGSSYESNSSSPPPRQLPLRQRTHTMDGAVRQQMASVAAADSRHRVGSFSSSSSQSMVDDVRRPAIESVGFPSIAPARPPEGVTSMPKEKKGTSARRLTKRSSSHPSSPLISPRPSVDSLPLPIPTDNPNRVLLLMRNLCGRMRGEIEYQAESSGSWQTGICYIDEDKGCLMFDSSQNGPSRVILIPDLRGCRVLPVEHTDQGKQCLEVVYGHTQPNIELLIHPLLVEELDLWLAALLCWQQLRPSSVRVGAGKATTPQTPTRPYVRRCVSSNGPARSANVIKVGRVMLWDKGLATSPRSIVKRPSTRDLRSPATSWKVVSCMLEDNGVVKLVTETDSTIITRIELSQLSRSAIQQLDRTVLDEEYCLAIFPLYSSKATQLSIFRPAYIALDSRVAFEVWFVLLRAFAVPDIYRIDSQSDDQVTEVTDLEKEYSDECFRVGKTLSLRVTEAKLKPKGPALGLSLPRSDSQENLVGNYLAEVIVDGEVRARTTTKSGTKNPFWREDCMFSDLPPSLPPLSIILKRVDGNTESLGHQLQSSLSLPKSGHLNEMVCGAVDIPLEQLDRGKDHEQWHQILDDKQQSIGTMYVKVQHEELAILLAREYEPLSELLHRFPSGLTTQIAEVLPSNLRRLSEMFLNIFQASGSAGDWLKALVEDEIDGIGNQAPVKKYRFSNRLKSNDSMDSASDRELIVRDMGKSLAGEANLLFRGNSLLTQSLEFHMRRLGKEYLEDMLLDKIFEINEINPGCEVDPSRIQPNEDIQEHWDQLIRLTTEVWECIANSASRLPTELRQILKYIRAVAEDRYGDFLRIVKYTSVSGFLFLRFICPAILSPKLFGLLRDLPRPRAQRTFTMIAKSLQALANLTTFGQKESWMEPMNKFLNSQRQSLKDYIDEVCSVSAERGPSTQPASYSTPMTIMGRLCPNSREGFPSLPYLIDSGREFAMLVKLWMDNNPIGSGDLQQAVDGDLLIFDELCRNLHTRAADCLVKIEKARNVETASHQSPEDLVEILEHASLIDSVNLSYGNTAVWMENESQNLRPPGSSGSEMEGGDRHHRVKKAREHTTLRKASGQSDVSSSPSMSNHGTLRQGRNGRTTRNILSDLIRGVRGDSPDASSRAPRHAK